MNKQQIIAPLVAMGIVALVGVFLFSRNQSRGLLRARTYNVANEIISTTNSSSIHTIGPDLHATLVELLGSPTSIVKVPLGDESYPIGDGRASVRLFLKNDAGKHIGIRLLWNADINQFDVLGYWTL